MAAVPLSCAGAIALALACFGWRHAAHRPVAAGAVALAVAVFAGGIVSALRNRIGVRLERVRIEAEALRIGSGQGERAIELVQVRDVQVRDVFPLEVVTLRLADDARCSFAFAHRNAFTRLRSPMLAELLARLPDTSVRERAPRLGGEVSTLPWWARCPELMAIPLATVLAIGSVVSCYLIALAWPAAFDAPPWWVAIAACCAGAIVGTMVFLAIRSSRTPPDVRLWKGVLLVRCKRRGRWVERCHPLDGVAGVRYSRALGRTRRVCLFAIELRGVLSSRALRITFPAQSSQAVLRTLRWPGTEAVE
ncbi:hypothetical protein [Lysobacter auxotrophicus]|uniref:hypothetical protein n=1 Tax=Lysobacter auxotrophicus TaxID=2992573 RepID=UPI00248F4D49|nr:hypothetical protein [Lysobacter auxotrophicus]